MVTFKKPNGNYQRQTHLNQKKKKKKAQRSCCLFHVNSQPSITLKRPLCLHEPKLPKAFPKCLGVITIRR